MDILVKISKLRNERKWSIYKLSEESGVSQSTISNMFTRKTDPSVITLKAICDAFNISLGEFFAEDDQTINEMKNAEFVNNFNKLTEKEKNAISNLIKSLLKK